MHNEGLHRTTKADSDLLHNKTFKQVVKEKIRYSQYLIFLYYAICETSYFAIATIIIAYFIIYVKLYFFILFHNNIINFIFYINFFYNIFSF